MLDDPDSHSHKARVIGDIMIVNSEQNGAALGRKSDDPRHRSSALSSAHARAHPDRSPSSRSD